VFDNSSGRIQGEFANYNELSVKRIVTREAQSTYLLNGSKCRRRDVTDLFLGTGLGPRSYAIIEQGMISRLIESKPQELRVFIEEAAGISKYKERRRETETRIRHTRENLERLEDVRSELSTQLDKLQRQAAAANRYKELKSKERLLKGELAGIRWLAHHTQMQSLEHQISESETECEALIAKQRGEEKGLVEYKQSVSELTQVTDELQQSLFNVSTEITRIEQNQKYAQQRSQQIEGEIAEASSVLADLTETAQQIGATLQKSETTLAELEPEIALMEEQLFTAIDERDNAESTLSEFAKKFREQEQQYAHLKQQAQTCHSQIQSTMSMQMRTQQRLSDINAELDSLEHDQLQEQLSTLLIEQEGIEAQFLEAEELQESKKSALKTLSDQELNLRQEVDDVRAESQKLTAEIEALKRLQAESDKEGELALTLSALPKLWQTLKVKKGTEHIVDSVLQQMTEYCVVEDINALSKDWLETPGYGFWLRSEWTSEKQAGTLGECILNEKIPNVFNSVYLAENHESAIEMLSDIPRFCTVVSQQGVTYTSDQIHSGVGVEQSKTSRQAEIGELSEREAQASARLDEQQEKIASLQAAIEQAQFELSDSSSSVQFAQQAKFQLQNRVGVVQMQVEQSHARMSTLKEDKLAQQNLLEKEQMQLDELSAKVAEIEEKLLDFESEQLQYEQIRERHEVYVQETRGQVEQLTATKHAKDIEKQQIAGQVSGTKERLESTQSQIDQNKSRIEKLSSELRSIQSPQSSQQDEIELLIHKREEIVALKLEKSEQLTTVKQLLSDAEKDQQGISEQLEKRRANLESLKLDFQGFKVRSDAVLEQLDELEQGLKDVLERLTEEANEKEWQANLDKTQSSISRLGAVNLAAVDEFDVQAERKQHLDTQYEDLNDALTTLEDAIRKIDKETKLRFSQTFDQVNSDLKGLFPKVFGGGSAYLALTDDDLLETGVTIMARPPGKKNSTIHLLSGGEKALTALSLVFAIFRLNPAPFCLLDEVDAPLDDANVARFCRLVSEMSKTVQFIYITHNKIAMEMAEHLTGVTMAEPGVSRMVAVDVEEAVAIANA
jgi:chromosome segregation protein